jgi:hypothetical protein
MFKFFALFRVLRASALNRFFIRVHPWLKIMQIKIDARVQLLIMQQATYEEPGYNPGFH